MTDPASTPTWPRTASVRTLDMMPDGRFRTSQAPARPRWLLRVGVVAALVAVAGVGLIGAVLAVWLVSMLIPVVVVAGLVAWMAFRVQLWRARRDGGELRRRA